MSDSRAAVGFDRLPWLSDEPRITPAQAPARRGVADLAGWAVAAMLLVAGASYWVGTRTASTGEPERSGSAATVPLPAPRAPLSGEQVSLPPRAPQIAPMPAPVVDVPRPRMERPAARTRPA